MLSSAFVLHRYPYQETSLLLKVFTREQGLISLIIKNAKKKKSDAYSLLQVFQPLKIEYALKGDLGTLKQVERFGDAPQLQKEALYSGFYLNELLLALLPAHDPVPTIFDLYAHTLNQLEHHVELALRVFELNLLKQLGFLPHLDRDEAGLQVNPEKIYLVTPGHELRLVEQQGALPEAYVFSGRDLLNLTQGNWNLESLKAAKRLCRIFIEDHTRGRVFKSREIFAVSRALTLNN